MEKRISIILMLTVSLSLVLSGCGPDGSSEVTAPEVGATTGSVETSSGTEPTAGSGSTEPQKGYLDEATGIYHTTLFNADNIPISFSVPDGWRVMDGLYGGAAACSIFPPEGVNEKEVPGVIIKYNLNHSNSSVQETYDSDNENGQLGESHEVTYGSNTYISNVTPTDKEWTYFYLEGKSGPIVLYVYTLINDSNRVQLEEILSTLAY